MGYKVKKTGFTDMKGRPILEGDILVGKTDKLHPFSEGLGVKERDFVKANFVAAEGQTPFWNWNGFNLESVSSNVVRVGTIFEDPELLLWVPEN